MEEIWKQIPECPRYEASSLGRIRGTDPRNGEQTVRAQFVSSHGYKVVNVQYKDGKRKSATVHSLVCSAFHGVRPEGHDCRHGERGPLDNCPDNLQWGTRQENLDDQKAHGTFAWSGKRKLSDDDVREILRRIDAGDRIHVIASEYGVAHGVVSGINLGNYHVEITGRKPEDAIPKAQKQNRSLTKEKVFEIVTLLDSGVRQKKIADQYGVTPQNVSDISTGKLWSWATGRTRAET